MAKCGRCCSQRGPSGDDIVDHDDPTSIEAWAGDELGPMEALDSRPPRLRGRRTRPYEQPPAWHAELAGDVASDQFALVETSRSAPGIAGGRPGDHVEEVLIAAGHDGVHHQAGEVPRDLTTVAVLESEHDVTGPPGEGQRRPHAMGTRLRPGPEQGESAGGAHCSSRGITTGTTNLEHHGHQCDEGVSHS